jgi:aminopeptidase
VRVEADAEDDREFLAAYLARDRSAGRLGELALVDSSSRVGAAGRPYFTTLLDENAAAHMAFGSGFAKTRTVPIGQRRYGVNRAKTHIDVMIGTPALNADGITQSGRRVQLVSDGTWRF